MRKFDAQFLKPGMTFAGLCKRVERYRQELKGDQLFDFEDWEYYTLNDFYLTQNGERKVFAMADNILKRCKNKEMVIDKHIDKLVLTIAFCRDYYVFQKDETKSQKVEHLNFGKFVLGEDFDFKEPPMIKASMFFV